LSGKDHIGSVHPESIILTPVIEDDALFVKALRNNPENNTYLQRKPFKDINEAQQFVLDRIDAMQSGREYYWVITDKQKGLQLGTVCLWNLDASGKVGDIGYEIHPDFRNMGIMTIALDKLLSIIFTEIGIEKLFAFTHVDNKPSRRLLDRNAFHTDMASPQPTDGFIKYYLDRHQYLQAH